MPQIHQLAGRRAPLKRFGVDGKRDRAIAEHALDLELRLAGGQALARGDLAVVERVDLLLRR
jgi:hypothetical protein